MGMGKRCTCPIGRALRGQTCPLRVVVLSATGLRNAAWVGKSYPYCTLEIADRSAPQGQGQSGSRLATKVIDNNLNPEWNEEFEVAHYCVGDSLKFTVNDIDSLKQDDPLGQVTVDSSQFCESGFEGDLQLSGDGAGTAAFLKVRISVPHPKETVSADSGMGKTNDLACVRLVQDDMVDTNTAPTGLCC